MVGDQRVTHTVAAVETVPGKIGNEVKNLASLVLGKAVLQRPFDKILALLGHDLSLFLPHRPAQ